MEHIEFFWQDRVHQQHTSWSAHQEINSVMLAISLAPNGYLFLQYHFHEEIQRLDEEEIQYITFSIPLKEHFPTRLCKDP